MEREDFIKLVTSVSKVQFKPSNPLEELRDKAQEIYDTITERGGRPFTYRLDIENRLSDLNNSNAKGIGAFRKYKKELVQSLEGITGGF